MKKFVFSALGIVSIILCKNFACASNNVVNDDETARKRLKTAIKNQSRPVSEAETLPEQIIVISCDGGGMRGVITAEILTEVQRMMNGHKIQDVGNVFAGTSTGGMIATALCSAKLSKFNGQDMIEVAQSLYKTQGQSIFNTGRNSTLGRVHTFIKSIFEEKYSSDGIERALKNELGDYTFSDLEATAKTLIIPSVDISCPPPVECAPFIMNSRNKDLGSVKLWEACRATSAAPTYFNSFHLKLKNDLSIDLVDGGIICNHPGRVAVQEICKNYANFDPLTVQQNIKLISFGTGMFYSQGKTLKDGFNGLLGWAAKITPASMCSAAQLVDTELKASLGKDRYMRVNPLLLKEYEMSDASPNTIAIYEDISRKYVIDNPKIIANAAAMLLGQKIQD